MPSEPKDPAQMTDAELVEAVAVEVMGWDFCEWTDETSAFDPNGRWNPGADCYEYEAKCFCVTKSDDCDHEHCHYDWNPLTDWNHWREVEEKMMQDEKLWNEFIFKLHSTKKFDVTNLMKADLRTRCIAALQAVRSQAR